MISVRNPQRVGLVLCLLLLAASRPSGQTTLASTIDAIVTSPISAGRIAGISIAVMKGTETIMEKAYGFADLQLDVPTPPRAVYEIGSITKQFTAAAILLLAEDGRLSLDDELTKHLPDYPTQGHRVTIRHLLNHTSGIRSYTGLPDFQALFAMQSRPRQELVQLFSGQPFDFAPGEELSYNNSGFFLLGLILEKVTGAPYEEFVRTRLFDRAGMNDSSYCSERQIRKKKVQGYSYNKTLVHNGYLDHTWPYSGGSLCSTAHDLVLWNRALHGGRLLTPDSYRLMTTPGALNDGTTLRYAMGITNLTREGRRVIEHDGNISGFSSHLAYYPSEDLTIAVLMNTNGPVDRLAREIAEAVLGSRSVPPRSFGGDVAPFAGTYERLVLGGRTQFRFEARGADLYLVGDPFSSSVAGVRLRYLDGDTFGLDDTLFVFRRENGHVSRVRRDTVVENFTLSRTPASTQSR